MKKDISDLFDIELEPENGPLPDPVLLRYYQELKNRTIIINEDIVGDIIERAIIPLKEMDEDGSGKPITIIINTPGGEIFSGFELVNVIENLKTKTTIRIIGMAASMGIYIAMAHAKNPNVETVCSKYSVGLFHAGSISLGVQNTKDAGDFMDFNKDYEETLVKPYVLSHTKITEDEYNLFERKQLWLTAEKMLEYGMVSKIE